MILFASAVFLVTWAVLIRVWRRRAVAIRERIVAERLLLVAQRHVAELERRIREIQQLRAELERSNRNPHCRGGDVSFGGVESERGERGRQGEVRIRYEGDGFSAVVHAGMDLPLSGRAFTIVSALQALDDNIGGK